MFLGGAAAADTSLPSPLVGGGGERGGAGEGSLSTNSFAERDPSPGSVSLRSTDASSPTRGEGTSVGVATVRATLGICDNNLSHKYCATFVSWYSSTRMYLKRL